MKRRFFLHLSFVSLMSFIFISNFDEIRYSKEFDKKGNKYVYDRFTGKKWKTIR